MFSAGVLPLSEDGKFIIDFISAAEPTKELEAFHAAFQKIIVMPLDGGTLAADIRDRLVGRCKLNISRERKPLSAEILQILIAQCEAALKQITNELRLQELLLPEIKPLIDGGTNNIVNILQYMLKHDEIINLCFDAYQFFRDEQGGLNVPQSIEFLYSADYQPHIHSTLNRGRIIGHLAEIFNDNERKLNEYFPERIDTEFKTREQREWIILGVLVIQVQAWFIYAMKQNLDAVELSALTKKIEAETQDNLAGRLGVLRQSLNVLTNKYYTQANYAEDYNNHQAINIIPIILSVLGNFDHANGILKRFNFLSDDYRYPFNAVSRMDNGDAKITRCLRDESKNTSSFFMGLNCPDVTVDFSCMTAVKELLSEEAYAQYVKMPLWDQFYISGVIMACCEDYCSHDGNDKKCFIHAIRNINFDDIAKCLDRLRGNKAVNDFIEEFTSLEMTDPGRYQKNIETKLEAVSQISETVNSHHGVLADEIILDSLSEACAALSSKITVSKSRCQEFVMALEELNQIQAETASQQIVKQSALSSIANIESCCNGQVDNIYDALTAMCQTAISTIAVIKENERLKEAENQRLLRLNEEMQVSSEGMREQLHQARTRVAELEKQQQSEIKDEARWVMERKLLDHEQKPTLVEYLSENTRLAKIKENVAGFLVSVAAENPQYSLMSRLFNDLPYGDDYFDTTFPMRLLPKVRDSIMSKRVQSQIKSAKTPSSDIDMKAIESALSTPLFNRWLDCVFAEAVNDLLNPDGTIRADIVTFLNSVGLSDEIIANGGDELRFQLLSNYICNLVAISQGFQDEFNVMVDLDDLNSINIASQLGKIITARANQFHQTPIDEEFVNQFKSSTILLDILKYSNNSDQVIADLVYGKNPILKSYYKGSVVDALSQVDLSLLPDIGAIKSDDEGYNVCVCHGENDTEVSVDVRCMTSAAHLDAGVKIYLSGVKKPWEQFYVCAVLSLLKSKYAFQPARYFEEAVSKLTVHDIDSILAAAKVSAPEHSIVHKSGDSSSSSIDDEEKVEGQGLSGLGDDEDQSVTHVNEKPLGVISVNVQPANWRKWLPNLVIGALVVLGLAAIITTAVLTAGLSLPVWAIATYAVGSALLAGGILGGIVKFFKGREGKHKSLETSNASESETSASDYKGSPHKLLHQNGVVITPTNDAHQPSGSRSTKDDDHEQEQVVTEVVERDLDSSKTSCFSNNRK